jgi:hypothetical protein
MFPHLADYQHELLSLDGPLQLFVPITSKSSSTQMSLDPPSVHNIEGWQEVGQGRSYKGEGQV